MKRLSVPDGLLSPLDSLQEKDGDLDFLAVGSTYLNVTVVENVGCPVGQYGALGGPPCQPCSPGFYGSAMALGNEAGGNCSGMCPAGKYSVTGVCVGCAPGLFGSQPGANASCSGACPVGTYSLGSATNCTACPMGR